jgi:hypothetical protein
VTEISPLKTPKEKGYLESGINFRRTTTKLNERKSPRYQNRGKEELQRPNSNTGKRRPSSSNGFITQTVRGHKRKYYNL